ncbi:unnamed protein product [Cylicocyclus nassatus]|uniref:Uncharacterized protein n=1 Tax=Cylicocyclus nassatus TaxID=53992 RepID=A0AA36M8S6_CYLNA|nr:unnamed protein product [Cylicocyclus nassatus]
MSQTVKVVLICEILRENLHLTRNCKLLVASDTSTSTYRMKAIACLVTILLTYNFTPVYGKVVKDKDEPARTKRCIGIMCCITGGTSSAGCSTGYSSGYTAAAPAAAASYAAPAATSYAAPAPQPCPTQLLRLHLTLLLQFRLATLHQPPPAMRLPLCPLAMQPLQPPPPLYLTAPRLHNVVVCRAA